jgi:hypothetical protein
MTEAEWLASSNPTEMLLVLLCNFAVGGAL